ncbi:hypothetical protein ASG01_14315 [Chryseobacterium sp. Leaf180]|uniref:PepSY-like domain-containing protein n=1 Tax=Chryseobacterium sp. Leaf180 TaxID=1736289 RepID=UPI0006FF760D|nr:PepSY-like domain-containing protein [Chryseobacterium sp. Leaf180]KQR91060.1 hypothetical protein ASG01_14315 [Chryseobacterium sp. Leaf180]
MKKLVLACSIVALSFSQLSAQDIQSDNVPAAVRSSFQKMFPKASDAEWEMKGNLYEVDFETGALGDDHTAYFSKDGRLMKHEEEIANSNLPKTVSASISKSFAGYSVDDAKKITEGKKVTYRTELKNGTQEWKVAFDAQGRVLEKRMD